MQNDRDRLKQQAAWRAVEEVRSGMVLGLGHGSTAVHALRRVAELLGRGALENVLGVPCSREVKRQAQELGLPMTSLEEHPVLDLTIDGADEADPELRLIKGGGGALLREKIVAQASRREIIVADIGKLSQHLGEKHPLPVEVLPFGWKSQAEFLAGLGADWRLRLEGSGQPFTTDQGNYILDCAFGPIRDPEPLSRALSLRAGLIGHGLFIGLATELILAEPGGIRILKPKTQSLAAEPKDRSL